MKTADRRTKSKTPNLSRTMRQAIQIIASYDNVTTRQALAGALGAELLASKKRFEANWGTKIKPSNLKPMDLKFPPPIKRILAAVRKITGNTEDGPFVTAAVLHCLQRPKAQRYAALAA